MDDLPTARPGRRADSWGGKGCASVKGDKTKVRCTTSKTPTRVRAYLYDGNDSVADRTDLPMTADGGTGADSLTGGPKGDLLRGGTGTGTDHLYGLGGNDHIEGGSGNDHLYGGPEDDFIEGNWGNDVLYGEGGNDTLSGEQGSDKLSGGAGDDTLLGDDFDDPKATHDTLDGGVNGTRGDACYPTKGDTVTTCELVFK